MWSELLFTLVAAIAITYVFWLVGERNNDGPWLGIILGALVVMGGTLHALGY